MPKERVLLTTKQLTMVAFLVAMAVVLKSFLSFETGSFRFTFYDIPMMIIGILMGPVVGGLTGIIVDFFHMMFSPWAFTFNIFTVENMIWAIIPGIFLFRKPFTRTRLVAVLVPTAILAFGLNTIGIVQYSGMGAMLATLPYRIAVLFVKLPVQVFFLETIYDRVLLSSMKLVKSR